MNKFGVTSKKGHELKQRMAALNINENDLVEKFVKSTGPGGQHLNKTASCVFLKHKLSGIEVKCQKERSQALNRFFARRILCDQLEQLTLGLKSQIAQKRQKIHKQKLRRKRKSKAKSNFQE